MDIALVRAMQITEKLNLLGRAGAFNALDHTNRETPKPVCERATVRDHDGDDTGTNKSS